MSCHDNHTLWDRLLISCADESEEERIKMHKLALATVLTSQGVPFLHAGSEMLRTKGKEENSYKSPDSVNQLDWSRKTTYKDVHDYVQGLIALRKAHPAFRMTTTKAIQANLRFLELEDENTIAYTIGDNANKDEWQDILVILNGNKDAQNITIPEGNWTLVVDGEKVEAAGIKEGLTGELTIPGRCAYVLYKKA